MEDELKQLSALGHKPRLLLHSCCAPCSSHVLTVLCEYFDIEVFFYNPNIYPFEEYERRIEEQARLVSEMGLGYKVIRPNYDSNEFFNAVKGYEKLGEGSERCHKCFRLRLERACQYAKEHGFDFFTTTLTISPLKNAAVLNEIGEALAKEYDMPFLNSDFKKKEGYKHSIELSHQYNLYRQNYCGCVFSKRESIEREKNSALEHDKN